MTSPGNNKLLQKIKNKCLKGHQIKHFLGSGSYGEVYASCLNNNCDYAVKIQQIDDERDQKDFLREVNIGKEMTKHNISVPIKAFWFCKSTLPTLAVIVQEKYDQNMSYRELRDNLKIKKKAYDLVQKMHAVGVIHADLFPRNIMYKKTKSGREKIRFIDWGLAWKYKKSKFGHHRESFIDSLIEHYRSHVGDHSFVLENNTNERLKDNLKLLDYVVVTLKPKAFNTREQKISFEY